MVSSTLERIRKTYLKLCSISMEEIERQQLLKLKKVVAFHFKNNPIYRKMVQTSGVQLKHIQSLKDLRLLPVFDGDTITSYGHRFYSCPNDAITYLHTSGSTGASKIIPITVAEKSILAFNDALTAYILGVRNGPIYCTFPCGPWPSAFFAQNGSEMLAATIRADMGLPVDWHIPVLKRFRPKTIMASPSYISVFVTELRKRGIDVGELGVDRIKLAGEPLSHGLRYAIEAAFNAEVLDLYGSAEIGAASTECPHLKNTGYHHYLANQLIYEVQKVGSNGVLCDPGEQGELLVTALFRYSVPIIRYNTKDLVKTPKSRQRCSCGLGLPLCSAVLGRSDDMLTYGGANVYPEMIYKSLAMLGLDDKFQVLLEKSNEHLRDTLTIRVERRSDNGESFSHLERELEKNLRKQSAELDYVFERKLVNPIRLDLVDYGELYQGGGKSKRFLNS